MAAGSDDRRGRLRICKHTRMEDSNETAFLHAAFEENHGGVAYVPSGARTRGLRLSLGFTDPHKTSALTN